MMPLLKTTLLSDTRDPSPLSCLLFFLTLSPSHRPDGFFCALLIVCLQCLATGTLACLFAAESSVPGV